MRKTERTENLPTHKYVELASSLEVFTTAVVIELGTRGGSARRAIIRNQAARAAELMHSIFRLYLADDIDSGWVLFRCLVERLFHVYNLIDTDSFDRFEDWSFLEAMNVRNRARSDRRFRERLDPEFWKDDPIAAARWRRLRDDPPLWARPKPEDVAKKRGLGFLYTMGYDFASAKVHPMADDGHAHFLRMVTTEGPVGAVDQRVLLHNTVLVASLVVNESIRALGLRWQRPVVEYPHCLTECLVSGGDEHRELLRQVLSVAAAQPLSTDNGADHRG